MMRSGVVPRGFEADRLVGVLRAHRDRAMVLKGPRRGLPLSAEGLDEILDGAPPPGWSGACDLP